MVEQPEVRGLARSSASCVPEPATRKRVPGTRSISAGIASSAIWKPFS